MRSLNPLQLANELKMVAQISERLLMDPLMDLDHKLGDLGQYLKDSETKLIMLMNKDYPTEKQPGSTQFGLVLYDLESRHPVLKGLLKLPPTQITDEMVQTWEEQLLSGGIVGYDGTLIAVGKYDEIDAGWTTALIYYLALKLGIREVSSWATFGATPQIIDASNDELRIALIGDWGTGDWVDGAFDCPALEVIDQVREQQPHYTIHLGDVYYAGTAGFLDSDEEIDNFVKYWWPGSDGSFMLNSNHEMYSGAQGLFNKGLQAAPFANQKNTSYFAIQNDSWLIIGLDTAYYDPSHLFMNGQLSDEGQLDFIAKLSKTNKKVIVLTHHNATNLLGTEAAPLWQQVTTALGRAPDFWYWGHVHNAVAYSSQSYAAQNGTKARCVGHSAIPFGVAYGLHDGNGNPLPTIDYFAHELMSTAYENVDAQQSKRVLNGYVMLTLKADSITEQFIDQTGKVRWQV